MPERLLGVVRDGVGGGVTESDMRVQGNVAIRFAGNTGHASMARGRRFRNRMGRISGNSRTPDPLFTCWFPEKTLPIPSTALPANLRIRRGAKSYHNARWWGESRTGTYLNVYIVPYFVGHLGIWVSGTFLCCSRMLRRGVCKYGQ